MSKNLFLICRSTVVYAVSESFDCPQFVTILTGKDTNNG